jgi:molecular chaperone DnaJ
MSDPFTVLGLDPETDLDKGWDEVRRAHKRAMAAAHPDRNPGDPGAADRFRAVGDAYRELERRRETRTVVPGSPNIEDMFRDMFRDHYKSGLDDILRDAARRSHAARQKPMGEPDIRSSPGTDVTVTLDLTLAEAVTGVTKEISVKVLDRHLKCESCDGTGSEAGKPVPLCMTCKGSGQTIKWDSSDMRAVACGVCRGSGRKVVWKCPLCEGTGKLPLVRTLKVKIPSGVTTGSELRIAGHGSPGSRPGDLFLSIRVAPDDNFVRSGQDLLVAAWVPVSTCITGGKEYVKGIDGSVYTLGIEPGTSSGTVVRVHGGGVRTKASSGDLVVEVRVAVPVSVSPRAAKLAEELAEELRRSPSPPRG